jgi:hypothetical protein
MRGHPNDQRTLGIEEAEEGEEDCHLVRRFELHCIHWYLSFISHKMHAELIGAPILHPMDLARDVIDQEGDTFEFYATYLVAAVVTQIFSYMIDSGVQYGYICTGEAFNRWRSGGGAIHRPPVRPDSGYT